MQFKTKEIFSTEYYKILQPYIVRLEKSKHLQLWHVLERIEAFKKPNSTYSILAYISTLFDNIHIIELGTRYGLSALALSYNPKNTVISYDIIDDGQFNIKKDNLTFKIENIIIKEKINTLLSANLIFIDIDPHDGKNEDFIINYLTQNQYTGIVIMDDINFGGIQNVWKSIKYPKYDISGITEDPPSGMGIISFDSQFEVI